MSRIFSGIQPSGELHIGNYLGAVKNWVQLQETHAGALFCVVDYHAITGAYDPAVLRARRWGMAKSLLAAGIDPAKAVLFMQSDVPEHTELSWIFTTLTPLGDLERQTQFKDKSLKVESIPAGLLMYPVLQSADILLYRADTVPVGEDQVQHLGATVTLQFENVLAGERMRCFEQQRYAFVERGTVAFQKACVSCVSRHWRATEHGLGNA
jgi:tryptophanyl-tRNA synthetase